MFVIQSTVERDEETGNLLYWSNVWGWTTLDCATIYDKTTQYTPANSQWLQLE